MVVRARAPRYSRRRSRRFTWRRPLHSFSPSPRDAATHSPPTALPSPSCWCAAASCVAGCQPAKGDMPAMPPPEVTTSRSRRRASTSAYEYVGQTEGSREVEVRARVTGIVLERQYEEGAPVKAGAPLFLIDPAPFEVAVAQAQAELASAAAREAQTRREGGAPQAADRRARGQPARIRRRPVAARRGACQRAARAGPAARSRAQPRLHPGHRRRSPA